MHIFDEIERTVTGPAQEATSSFEWINICADPYAASVRDVFEKMIANYPESEREHLVSRIRSVDNSEHRSALLELVMHAWLIQQGHEILAVEPELEHTPRSPDFLVRAPDGKEYYLEATARQEEDDRLSEVRDAINAIDSPIYLDVTIRGVPKHALSAKKIAQKVSEHIKEIDKSSDRAAWPHLRFEEQGAKFEIRPFLLKSEKRRNSRTIGMFSSGSSMVSSTGDIDRLLKKKAGRYGKLDKPFIVAVTTPDFTTKLYELTSALFGSEAAVIDRNNPSAPVRAARTPDGVWRNHPERWTNTGLSGVILVPDLSMTMFARRTPLFMMHPEPRHPTQSEWFDAETHALVDQQIQKIKDGGTLGKVFDLAEDWPE